MWLWYDWRAAAVADDTGAILDVEQWDAEPERHISLDDVRVDWKTLTTTTQQLLQRRLSFRGPD